MKVTATTYSELSKWASAFADRGIQAMLVYGDPGVGKSRTIASAVGASARVLTGEVSAIELYRELWRHRDMPFVVDDVDQLLKDRQMVKLLKSVCQTEEVKTVGWHTTSHLLAAESIPTEFQTLSRVAVLLNEYKASNLNVKAIEDRGVAIHFNPSAAEVHAQVGTWFADHEVYAFIGANLKLIPKPSMRMYVTASQIRQAGVDWRQALLDTWDVSPGVSLLLKLTGEPFASEEERAKAFVERGGGSRATYFRTKKRVSHTLAG